MYILVIVNPFYANVQIRDFANNDVQESLQQIPETILSTCVVCDDENVSRLEKQTSASSSSGAGTTRDGTDDAENPGDSDRIMDAVFVGRVGDSTGDDTILQRDVSDTTVLTALQRTLNDVNKSSRSDADIALETLPGQDEIDTNEPSTGNNHVLSIRRENNPICEFTSNDELMYGSFPWLFLFGSGVPKCGSLPITFTKFLLSHFNQGFAQDHKFLFTIFNQIQRHACVRASSLKVNARSRGTQNLMDTINDPDFGNKLQSAILHPNSREAKALLQKVMPNVSLIAAKVPFGVAERHNSLYKLYAMIQRYGLPTWFLSFAQKENDSPLCIRISCARTNVTLHEIQMMSKEERTRITSKNPVAAAIYFEKILNAVLDHLLGIRKHDNSKKMFCSKDISMGILGKIYAYFGAKECQGKGIYLYKQTICIGF